MWCVSHKSYTIIILSFNVCRVSNNIKRRRPYSLQFYITKSFNMCIADAYLVLLPKKMSGSLTPSRSHVHDIS